MQTHRTMSELVLQLVRPYRAGLAVVFAAMLVETLMSLAAPWPLKIVLDNALGHHPLPHWLEWVHDLGIDRNTMGLALFAALATALIAAIGAVASYIDNYYTESVGQWVAHDLRMRIYDHLHRLSLKYYEDQSAGTLLSTMTSDVATVQDFASSSTLSIVVDMMTIAGMLVLMFWLNWDFALIAVGITPFLLLFVMRFKKAVKEATRSVRLHQSEIVAVVQQGLGYVRVVKAYGRRGARERAAHGSEQSHGRRGAAGAPREVTAGAGGRDRRCDLHGLRAVARHGADRRGCDDGRLAHGLPRLSVQVLQAGAGPGEDDQHDRADRGRPRAHPEDPRRRRRHPGKARCGPAAEIARRDRLRPRCVRLRHRRPGADATSASGSRPDR